MGHMVWGLVRNHPILLYIMKLLEEEEELDPIKMA